MTKIEQTLRIRLHITKDSRHKERELHHRHFAELSEVKGQLGIERDRRGRLETALLTIIKSLEDGTPPADVARSARVALGMLGHNPSS